MLFFFYGFIRKRKEKMKLSEYLKIGTKMKILRKEKGISQKEMAEILEMIPSAYSNYENHFTDIPVEIMKKFCDTVGCSMSELIGFDVSISEDVHPISLLSDLMLAIMELNISTHILTKRMTAILNKNNLFKIAYYISNKHFISIVDIFFHFHIYF